MKLSVAFIVAAMLSPGLVACGGASSDTPAQTTSKDGSSAPSGSIPSHGKDRDNDNDNNDDDEGTLGYGHLADSADGQAIMSLVKRYFADAATESGAKACALLTPFVAETVVEVDGHTSALKGGTCAAVMTKLFKQHHQDLLGKRTSLKIMRIGVEGDKSLVALDFPEIPEVRQIVMRRYNNRWTVLQMLDGIIE
jgi:hypothetical protein